MMSLMGCVTRIAKPSDDYLQDCPITYVGDGPVKGKEVIAVGRSNIHSLQVCNLDKQALRAYYSKMCKGYLHQCTGE
jgi:hypothetical protein